jgi:hypothetical protein
MAYAIENGSVNISVLECNFDLFLLNFKVGVGVGVLLAADSQSTIKSGYRASLWDP